MKYLSIHSKPFTGEISYTLIKSLYSHLEYLKTSITVFKVMLMLFLHILPQINKSHFGFGFAHPNFQHMAVHRSYSVMNLSSEIILEVLRGTNVVLGIKLRSAICKVSAFLLILFLQHSL